MMATEEEKIVSSNEHQLISKQIRMPESLLECFINDGPSLPFQFGYAYCVVHVVAAGFSAIEFFVFCGFG